MQNVIKFDDCEITIDRNDESGAVTIEIDRDPFVPVDIVYTNGDAPIPEPTVSMVLGMIDQTLRRMGR